MIYWRTRVITFGTGSGKRIFKYFLGSSLSLNTSNSPSRYLRLITREFEYTSRVDSDIEANFNLVETGEG
jgi:hypothetical protein